MSGKIGELINLHGLCLFQKPAKVIPKRRCVSNLRSADMGQLMNRYEGDNILVYEFFLLIPLSETHVYLLALIHRIRGI